MHVEFLQIVNGMISSVEPELLYTNLLSIIVSILSEHFPSE